MEKEDLIINLLKDSREDIKEIREDISEIHTSQIETSHDVKRNADDLSEHMRRTDLNEKRIESIEDKLTVGYLLKLVVVATGGVGTITGTVYGIMKILDSI
jgi:hypothetical protein